MGTGWSSLLHLVREAAPFCLHTPQQNSKLQHQEYKARRARPKESERPHFQTLKVRIAGEGHFFALICEKKLRPLLQGMLYSNVNK